MCIADFKISCQLVLIDYLIKLFRMVLNAT